MVQLGTQLKLADNTGAKSLKVIRILGGSKRRFAFLGDLVIAVVKQADPEGMVKSGEIVRSLVVRTKKEKRRNDGSYIRFDDNAAVIVDKTGNPQGTRILGPIGREIKDLGYARIASLAPEVI
jgi:large subunit ribosomal protein L14